MTGRKASLLGALLLAAAGFASASGRTRSLIDLPDDAGGYQVHAIYVIPSDGPDESLDTDGRMDASFRGMNEWLKARTGKTLRLDTRQGRLDISFHRLNKTEKQMRGFGDFVREHIEEQLKAAGFDDPKKIYAVYYGGSNHRTCGDGAWPPEIVGHVVVEYLKGQPPNADHPCGDDPVGADPQGGVQEVGMLHEIFHALGLVPTCGKFHHDNGHVWNDPTDIMYSGPKPWEPSKIDPTHDSYYRHRIAGCPDLDESVFLTPQTTVAVAPPGW